MQVTSTSCWAYTTLALKGLKPQLGSFDNMKIEMIIYAVLQDAFRFDPFILMYS